MTSMFSSFISSSKDAILSEAQSALKTVKRLGNEHLIGGALNGSDMEADKLGIYKITERLYSMGFPNNIQHPNGTLEDHISEYLIHHYSSKFMIWNLSEKSYDYSKYQNNVLEFRFPGYPSAPLDLVFSICDSIHSWLSADEKNIGIVHCQTGNGRTITLIAAYLSWSGVFKTPQLALEHIANIRSSNVNELIIPTQQRYSNYFNSLLNGYKPSIKPLKLNRLIMNGIPAFEIKDQSCRPYLQIFKNAKPIYSSSKAQEAKWIKHTELSVLFPVNINLEGDILIRIRHYSSDQKRISMLRFGFHTGFIQDENVRFYKKDLDGACDSNLFPEDFFLDLFFCKAIDDNGDDIQGITEPEFWDRVTLKRKSIVDNDNDTKTPFKFTLPLNDDDDNNNDNDYIKIDKLDNTNTSVYQDESFQDLADYVKGLEEAEAREVDIEEDLYEELRKLANDSDILDDDNNNNDNELDVEAALASLNNEDVDNLLNINDDDDNELQQDEEAMFLEAMSELSIDHDNNNDNSNNNDDDLP